MAPRFVIVFSLLLAACGQDVRDVRLAEVDLSNMTVVQQLGQQLAPAERGAFATFAAIHGRSSAGNCGLTLRGRQPETVGEAIEAMRVRMAQFAGDRRQAGQPGIAARPVQGAVPAPSLAEVTERTKAAGR